jgi:integrase
MSLTDRTAKTATWDGSDYLLADDRGLFLRVRKSSKTWVVRRRHLGRMRVTTLGDYPELSIKDARARAARLAARTPGSTKTVAELVEEFKVAIRATHRDPDQVDGYLRRGIPAGWAAQRVAQVTRSDVVALLKDYRRTVAKRGIPGRQGERATDAFRGILRQLFGLAVELGYRDDNPADQITRRVTGYHPQDRARVLSDDELRLLWADPHPNAALLRFLVATGVRISEAQKADPAAAGEDGIWSIPARFTKTHAATWVYLTDTARAQLEHYIPVSPTAVQAWTKRWCLRQGIPPFTPHDARRTFSTRLNELGTAPYIVEKMLNHRMTGVWAVYNKAENRQERIDAYRRLEAHLLSVVEPKTAQLECPALIEISETASM